MADTLAAMNARSTLREYWELTKPRVVMLLVFTALIGMFLATPELVPLPLLLAASAGIWLCAAAAAVINQWADREIDARMAAARRRIRHARARQVERTFTNLDADADGLLSLHEWRAGLSRHAGRREPGAAGMQATAVTAAHVASPKRSVPLPAENKTSAARVE